VNAAEARERAAAMLAEAGIVLSEFSTRSRDEADVFTDPRVVR
jgi:hypothetical protein